MRERSGGSMKIGIYEYELKEVRNLVSDDKEKTKLDGIIDHNSLTISIEKNLPDIAKQVTLWHEMLHAVSKQYSLGLGEEEVDCLAHGVVGILNDNKL
jgi:hypothetical protein